MWIRITAARDYALHAGLDDRVHARARASDVIARFERDVERCATCSLTGGSERDDLRVRIPGEVVKTLADYFGAQRNQRTDVRVRRWVSTQREFEGASHEPFIELGMRGVFGHLKGSPLPDDRCRTSWVISLMNSSMSRNDL